MQDRSKYDNQIIGKFTDALLDDALHAGQSHGEIEEMMADPRYGKEVEKALERVWEEIGRLEYDPLEVKVSAENTLAAIALKCPDFPAIPKKTIPLYRQRIFKVAAVIIPLFIMTGSLGVWYMVEKDNIEKASLSDNTPSYAMTESVTDLQEVYEPDGIYEKEVTRTDDTVEINVQTDIKTVPAISTLLIEANNGDKEVFLPDGTLVKLIAGSKLRYRTDFIEHREVALHGNAFFSVAKMNGKMFEVNYNNVTVSVLGTEFYLNEYQSKVEVTLKSGSVEVFAAEQSIILAPNQQFVMDLGSADFSVIELTEGQMAKMLRGRLSFNGTPLAEAIAKTGEFYGVEIDLTTMDDTEPIRMQFDENDTFEDVLFILQQISGQAFDYEITGTGVKITAPETEETN